MAVVDLDHPKVNAPSSCCASSSAGGPHRRPAGRVVVTGGDRIFAAGADISEFRGPDEARVIGGLFLRALDAVADIPRATIAADHRLRPRRWVRAGLACDFRIAPSGPARPARDPARHHPRRRRHAAPAPLVGPARAKDLIFTGRQVGADEALAIGLVDEVVPPERRARWRSPRGRRAGHGPIGPGLAKRAIDRGLDITLNGGLDPSSCSPRCSTTEDARIGVESFLETAREGRVHGGLKLRPALLARSAWASISSWTRSGHSVSPNRRT